MRRWRTAGNRAVDLGLVLGGAVLVATGVLLYWRLPPGSRGGHGLSVWGLDRHEWGAIHLVAGLACAVLALVHLALHWRWVWAVAASRRVWLLAAGLLPAVILIVLAAVVPVAADGARRQASGAGGEAGQAPTGPPSCHGPGPGHGGCGAGRGACRRGR